MAKEMRENGILFEKRRKNFGPSKRSFRRGFTLIEVVVVTAILAIVMGTVIGTGTSGKTQFNLSINQEKLRTLISRAKGLSLNSLVEQSGSAICGYGVHIEPGRAVVFADRDVGSGCANSTHVYNSGEELPGEINQMTIGGGIYFADVTSIPANPPAFGGGNSIDVLFFPPDPTTYINGLNSGETVIGVVSASKDTRKITVTNSGLISTESY